MRTDRRGPLAFLILVCLLASPAGAQERNFDGWDLIVDPSFARNPDRLVLRNFRVPESAEAERLIRSARDAIADERYAEAVATLHEVVTLHGARVFQAGRETCTRSRSCARFAGAAELAHFLLRGLPPEGRALYDGLAEKEVREELDDARARRDLEAVERIAAAYPASALGEEARLFLADSFVERGDADLALPVLKTSLLFARDPARDPARDRSRDRSRALRRRLARALDQAGLESEAGLTLSDRSDEALREALASAAPLAEPPGSDWPTEGGSPDRNRAMPIFPGASFDTPRWARDPFNDTLADRNPFVEKRDGPVPFRLVRDGESLIVNDSISVRAFSIYSGEVLWHHAGPLERRDGDRALFGIDDYIRHRGQAGSITNHLVAGATAAGPVLLVNLQTARPRRKKQYLYNEVINKPMPIRHLSALSASDGRLLWTQAGGDIDPDSFRNRLSIASPPVVAGNRIFCNGHLIEGGVRSFILCLDLETGAEIWRTPVGVGQQALTLFNMSFSEFVPTPLTLSEGTLYFCSNLGYMAALDAVTGRIRWCTEYETTELPRSRSYTDPPPRQVYWYNTPPRAEGDTVVATPLDARHAYAFDRHTGRARWALPARTVSQTDCRYFMGIRGGNAIFGGGGGAVAVDLGTGHLAWRTMALLAQRDGEPCLGLGALTVDRAFLSLGDKVVVVDVETGKLVEELPMGESIRRGQSLFLFGDVAVRVTAGSVRVSFDAESMLESALARLDGPGGEGSRFDDLAFIGDMYRLQGQREQAADYFRKALARTAGVKARSITRVRAGLFRVLYEDAADAFARGRTDRAEGLFRVAATHAPGPEEALGCLVELSAIHMDRKEWDRLEEVRRRLAGEFRQVDFRFGGRLGIGPGRAGFYAAVLACRAAAERNDPTARLAALRIVLETYPEDLFGPRDGERPGRSATDPDAIAPDATDPDAIAPAMPRRAFDWAAAEIAAILSVEGREIYAPYEQRAREIFHDALAEESAGLLQAVARLFPNSLVAPRAVLERARILIAEGNASEAFSSLSTLAGRAQGEGEAPHAFYLLGLAAAKEGNAALARAYHDRLRSRHSRVESLWDEGVRYGQLVPAPDRSVPSVARRPSLPCAPFVEDVLDLKTEEADLIAIEGLAPGGGADRQTFAGRALIRLTEPERLALVDTDTMAILWERDVEVVEPGDPQKALAVGQTLTVCYDECLIGLDGRTGRRLWGRHLEGWLLDFSAGRGVFRFATVPREGYEDDIIAVEAVNPVTGSTLWKRTIYGCLELRFVPSREVFAWLINDRNLDLVDPLTGATERRALLDCISAQPFRVASPPGRLLLKAGKPGRRNFLLAVDAATGEEAWRYQTENSIVSYGSLMLAPGALLLSVGSAEAQGYRRDLLRIDPATGKIGKTFELAPGDIFFNGSSELRDSLLYVQPRRATRSYSVSALDTATGLWRFEDAPVDLSDCGGRHRIVQEGVYAADGLIGAVSCLPAQRESTLAGCVFFLDGTSGKVTFFKQLFAGDGNKRGVRSRKEIGVQLTDDGVLLLAWNRLVRVRSQK